MKSLAVVVLFFMWASVGGCTFEAAAQEAFQCQRELDRFRAGLGPIEDIDRCIVRIDKAAHSATHQRSVMPQPAQAPASQPRRFSDRPHAGTATFGRSAKGDLAVRQRTLGPLRISSLMPAEARRLFQSVGYQNIYSAKAMRTPHFTTYITRAMEACYAKSLGNLRFVSSIQFERDHIAMAIGHTSTFRFVCRAYGPGVSIQKIPPFSPRFLFVPADAIPRDHRKLDAFRNASGHVVGLMVDTSTR